MKIAGIVAEYNPFHNGHRWQIEATRAAGASHIVAVMSGCYVQRGEPALWDKWLRTRAALLGGVDLVVELPLPYATATAQRFAYGGVTLLNALGVVDMLSFGSELGETQPLVTAARALLDPELERLIPQLMGDGRTFAAARQQAVEVLYGQSTAQLLQSPNNILGVEYIYWLLRTGSHIQPFTVARQGGGHDSRGLGQFSSASALRQMVVEQGYQGLEGLVPNARVFIDACREGCCYDPAALERPMLAALRSMSRKQLAELPDISEGLENRIRQAVKTAETVEGLLEAVKTKRYPHARLRRILLAAWLGIPAGLTAQPPPYIRVLGMNRRGQEVLSLAKKRAILPMSHSAARLQQLGARESKFISLEARADDLYGVVCGRIQPCGRTYTQPIISLE